MEEIVVRSGIEPKGAQLEYDITTAMAEEFVQNKLNFVVNQMRAAEQKAAQKDGRKPYTIPEIKISIMSMRFSKTFIPFIAIMGTECLRDRRGSRNNDEPDIFNPEVQSRGARVKDAIYNNIVKPYSYTGKDEQAFFAKTTRDALGLSVRQAHNIKAYRLPKIQKFNKGKMEYVTFMIDPLRLFYDMLAEKVGTSKPFEVIIKKDYTERIKGANYRYTVSRVETGDTKKKNRRREDSIAYELEKRIAN